MISAAAMGWQDIKIYFISELNLVVVSQAGRSSIALHSPDTKAVSGFIETLKTQTKIVQLIRILLVFVSAFLWQIFVKPLLGFLK